MRVSRLFLAAACAALSLVHGPASADAFSEGKELGTSQVDSVFNKAKTGEGKEAIPKYGTAAPEQGFFLGGKGSLSPHGVTKLNTCAGAAPGGDPMANQECEAVNFLAKNPQVRPQMPLSPNDPLFALHDQVSKDPCAILGPGYCDEEETQCVEVSETVPAQYSVETCSDIKELSQPQCVMGKKIEIDKDANYQCDETLNAYKEHKCYTENVVSVSVSYKCGKTGVTYSEYTACNSNCSSSDKLLVVLSTNGMWQGVNCKIYPGYYECSGPITCSSVGVDITTALTTLGTQNNKTYQQVIDVLATSGILGSRASFQFACLSTVNMGSGGECAEVIKPSVTTSNGCASLENK